jgi:hypothetical protein
MACCQGREDATSEPRTRGMAVAADDRDLVSLHNDQTTGESGRVRGRGERRSGGATLVVVMQTCAPQIFGANRRNFQQAGSTSWSSCGADCDATPSKDGVIRISTVIDV